jgi:DNA-binding CsgD family transcriptional regulator
MEEGGMPAKRELTMRQVRHMLRLAHDGVSAREIGRRLGVARSTIQDNLKRVSMLIEISSEVLTKIPQPEVPGRGGTAVDMTLRRGRSLDDAARRPHLHRCHDRRGRFRG